MKILKVSYWILGVCLCAVACYHGEENHRDIRRNIEFTAVVSHTTKSIIATTSYPQDRPFVVDALLSQSGTSGEPASYLFRAETASYDSDMASWKTAEDYRWPESGILEFYAYSPASQEATIDSENGVVADIAIKDMEDAQNDFCYAYSSEHCSGHPVTVPLVFSHALTQVAFKVKLQRNYESRVDTGDLLQENAFTVSLDSMRVRGLLTEGHFVQTPFSWTPVEGSYRDFWLYRGDPIVMGYDSLGLPASSYVATILAIPQELSDRAILDEWHTVRVHSTLTNRLTGDVTVTEYELPLSASKPLLSVSRRWIAENKYTYLFTLGLSKETGQLAATRTDWTESKEKFIDE